MLVPRASPSWTELSAASWPACRVQSLKLDCGYKIDLLVEDEVILELKAVEKLLPIHQAQLLTYLKLAHKRVGLLINFNVPSLTQGIIRRVL